MFGRLCWSVFGLRERRMNFVGLKVSEPRRLGTFESCFFLSSGNVVLICLVVVLFVSVGGLGACICVAFLCRLRKRGNWLWKSGVDIGFFVVLCLCFLLLQSLGAMNGETVNW